MFQALLRALGLDTEEILNTFYEQSPAKKTKKGWIVPFDAERMKGTKLGP